ncbi:MAG: hypothetical protein WDW38_009329 [Sanguina aurantia]
MQLRDNESAPDSLAVPGRRVKTSVEVTSRRFRVRMMGVTGDVFNEGYKIMMGDPLLINKATGENIIGYTKGYYRMAGERLGMFGFQHWCGTKQFSWFEWLVPDDQPAVILSEVAVQANVRHWVLEAMPEAVWPTHGRLLDSFKPLPFPITAQLSYEGNHQQAVEGAGAGISMAPPRWVTLHTVVEHPWLDSDAPSAEFPLSGGSPLCYQFRLRVTASDAECQGAPIAFSLQLKHHILMLGLGGVLCPTQASLPAGLYPIGGGTVSGSGGDAAAEDAPPSLAFDGNRETRWMDIAGGGIGNTALFAYQHTEPVEVARYAITSQTNALSSYHSGLSGAPRDWRLQGKSEEGQWITLDRREEVYFKTHWETLEFPIAVPVRSTEYRLEFTAVAAGCASRSLQVGNIQFFTATPAGETLLQQHQLITSSSAYDAIDHESSRSWSSEHRLSVQMPAHPPHLSAARGGLMAWKGRPDGVGAWYDWPLEFELWPTQVADGPVITQPTRCARPGKEPLLLDGTVKASFRREYGGREVQLRYTHTRPVLLRGYGFGSCENYVRADPQDWDLEGQDPDGSWILLHHVQNFQFQDRSENMTFYLPTNQHRCASYRFVLTRMNAMVGLLHLDNPVFLVEAAGGDNKSPGCETSDVGDRVSVCLDAREDLLPVVRGELGHVSVKVKECECEGGKARVVGYVLDRHEAGVRGRRATPTSWVLEGFTSEYQDS